MKTLTSLLSVILISSATASSSVEVTCLNKKNPAGKITVIYEDNNNKEDNFLSIDLSQDNNGVGSPYYMGSEGRNVSISHNGNTVILKKGHSFFNPIPFPNPNGGWFNPSSYADYDKVKYINCVIEK